MLRVITPTTSAEVSCSPSPESNFRFKKVLLPNAASGDTIFMVDKLEHPNVCLQGVGSAGLHWGDWCLGAARCGATCIYTTCGSLPCESSVETKHEKQDLGSDVHPAAVRDYVEDDEKLDLRCYACRRATRSTFSQQTIR